MRLFGKVDGKIDNSDRAWFLTTPFDRPFAKLLSRRVAKTDRLNSASAFTGMNSTSGNTGLNPTLAYAGVDSTNASVRQNSVTATTGADE